MPPTIATRTNTIVTASLRTTLVMPCVLPNDAIETLLKERRSANPPLAELGRGRSWSLPPDVPVCPAGSDQIGGSVALQRLLRLSLFLVMQLMIA